MKNVKAGDTLLWKGKNIIVKEVVHRPEVSLLLVYDCDIGQDDFIFGHPSQDVEIVDKDCRVLTAAVNFLEDHAKVNGLIDTAKTRFKKL